MFARLRKLQFFKAVESCTGGSGVKGLMQIFEIQSSRQLTCLVAGDRFDITPAKINCHQLELYRGWGLEGGGGGGGRQ